MLKKALISLIVFFTCTFSVFANEISNVSVFFNAYVNAANTYSNTVLNYYTSNAKIIRTVIKPDGTKATLVVPMDEYSKQLKIGQMGAKLVRYKNNYKNIKIVKYGNDYKITALRYPQNDKVGLSCYFVVTKTSTGYKFKVEQMDTKVQTFLKYIK